VEILDLSWNLQFYFRITIVCAMSVVMYDLRLCKIRPCTCKLHDTTGLQTLYSENYLGKPVLPFALASWFT